VVIGGFLTDGPGVEGLIHYQQTQVIAGIEEFRRGGIVGGADGVDAAGFERGEAAFPRGGGDGSAQSAGIGVEGDAEEFDVFAIEPEAAIRLEFRLADAEGRVFGIDGLGIHIDGCQQAVHGRRIRTPEFGVLDADITLEIDGFAGGNGELQFLS